MPKRKIIKRDETKWVKQWKVPSESNPSKLYTVSMDTNGNYVCHCWPFLRSRTTCKHIEQVKAGIWGAVGDESAQPEPEIQFCYVQEVQPEYEADGKTIRLLKTPLLPIGNTHFQATLMFDLHRYGVAWPTLVKRYQLDKSWTPASVEVYLREHGGRMIYGDWVEGNGFDGFKVVSMPS